MRAETSGLLPVAAAAVGVIAAALTRGTVSIVLTVVCVLLALVAVVRFIATINGHDPWRALRRRRRGRR